MMTLAEVASISIRANINIDTTKVGIKTMNYETATTNPAGNPLSTVEKCTCPEGYTGLTQFIRPNLKWPVMSETGRSNKL